MMLFQLQPSFFYIRQDAFTWMFMQTRLHQWLLNNRGGQVLFDVLFYTTPAIYLFHFRYNRRTAWLTAVCMFAINWAYIQCYTLYPTNSIEGYVAWLLFPVVFMVRKDETFNVLFEGLRYFFLFFFTSAGIWKLALGGIFHYHEMSGILLYQHNQLLTNSPGYWQAEMVLWLIKHPMVSYLLYLLVMLIELFFITGFFTKRFDRLLIVFFIIFLVTDYLVMRITYFDALPLVLTLVGRRKVGELNKLNGLYPV
jgi:hypothetical protein